MHSSIRYGHEADILLVTNKINRDEYWAIQNLGSTVLRFSGSLKRLPELDECKDLLIEHGVIWKNPDIPSGAIYIENEPPLERDDILKIADPLIRLAADFAPNHDGLIFVDHSHDPLGEVLVDHI